MPTFSMPHSLADWRNQAQAWGKTEYEPYDLWRPLIPFFQSHGLALWEAPPNYPSWGYQLLDPEGIERAPDGFSYLSHYYPDGSPASIKDYFQQINPIICPARTFDGRDVMIRLVYIKGDPSPSGSSHLTILRRIAKGHVACIGNNHVLPVLQELTDAEHGLTFVVQPKVFDCDELPKWYSAREAADFVVQIFEGLDFCHKHLIAHLDIGYDNILVNFRGGAAYPQPSNTSSETWPFRSHFPIRYYLNDFEIGLSFDENSGPSSRTTTGFPHTVAGRKGPYGRAPAPEMLKQNLPYCPFRLDVWQVGMMMKEKARFEDIGGLSEYQGLFDEMMAEDPLARPTMSEALRRARELRLTLPQVI